MEQGKQGLLLAVFTVCVWGVLSQQKDLCCLGCAESAEKPLLHAVPPLWQG